MARSHLFVLAPLFVVLGCPYARQSYMVENVAEGTMILAVHGAVVPNPVAMLSLQKKEVPKDAEQPQTAGSISSKTRSSKLVVNSSLRDRFLSKSKLGLGTRVAAGLAALFLVGLKLWQCRSAWFEKSDSGLTTAGQTSRRLAGRPNLCYIVTERTQVTEYIITTTVTTTSGGRTTAQRTTQTSSGGGGEGHGSEATSSSLESQYRNLESQYKSMRDRHKREREELESQYKSLSQKGEGHGSEATGESR